MADNIKDYKELKEKYDKAVFRLKMIEQYLSYIRKNFDQNTVFNHLEERNVHHSITWCIHKLLHHNVDDKGSIKLIETAISEKLLMELEPLLNQPIKTE